MARKKKGRPISGWIILDKPYDFGSTQAVGKLKWLFQAQKVGHAGTLDPLATGMLPIAFGAATKTVNYVMDGMKSYRFTVRWGEETNTDDVEGEVIQTSPIRPTKQQINAALSQFVGEIEQTPPTFSAIKIAGQRAYDLARAGEEVVVKTRIVFIERLQLVNQIDADHAEFELECGKGTYVRALARDLGRILGTCGHVSELRRTAVLPFGEADLVTLETLTELEGDFDALDQFLIPVGQALAELPELMISDDDCRRIGCGNPILVRGRDAPLSAEEIVATNRGEAVAIGQIEMGRFQPRRLLR